jgi:UDP-glucose 4-epimerase
VRVVVTGAKGFIGSVFALRAAELGHEVLALDDGSRGLNPIEQDKRVTFMQHDCLAGIGEAVLDGWPTVDAVVHLAAATGSLERPLEELLVLNVDMLKRVYADALALGAKCFIWPTTSLALEVPDSPYVVSKELGLKWLLGADAAAKIAVPVRFFNVAGAYRGFTERRKKEVHLIPRLVECALTGQPLLVSGTDYETADGTPSREFTHVLDVAEYVLRLMAEGGTAARHPDGTIWIGTGRPTTVLEAVRIVEQALRLPIMVHYGPRRAYDCGRLHCVRTQALAFSRAQAGLIPARVAIRDEALALTTE